MKRLILFVLWLILMIIWSSCGVRFHTNRYEYHKEKLEELGVFLSSDTTYIDRIQKIEGFSASTEFTLKNGPVKFEKRNLVLEFSQGARDTIRVDILQRDTVFKYVDKVVKEEVPVYIEKECSFWDLLKWWQWALVGLFFLSFLLLMIAIKR